MSTLKTLEKTQLEDLLGMSSGYVLDFTNRTFADFFNESANTDIYAHKYATKGNSKAKRLCAFWEIESDVVVGKVLNEFIEYWHYKNPQPNETTKALLAKCIQIVERLLGTQVRLVDSEKVFLEKDFGEVSIHKVQIDTPLVPILESRLSEAIRCIQNDAPLASIFLCGSILEGLLLGVAGTNPRKFNQAPNSPKDDSGKVKTFQYWKLTDFIDVACELGYLKLDVKKFGHALRDFRNYIHPYQQLNTGFDPDKHTAEICLQVLKAAIANLSGQRT